MPAKRYPIPKRFSAAMSEDAYARLRKLHQKYHDGNNYLLTILLENFDEFVDEKKLDQVFARFAEEYGAPIHASTKSEL